jgi:hypothetical protein
LVIEVQELVRGGGKLTIKVDEGAILDSFVATRDSVRSFVVCCWESCAVKIESRKKLAQKNRGVICMVAVKTSRAT